MVKKFGDKVIDPHFWKDKKLFITGHTGFKGSWLSLWLHTLGANVTGYALHPPTDPSLFELCKIDQLVTSYIADIRDRERVLKAVMDTDPDVVIHMAAQPLVRESYHDPVGTYEINTMGTIYLLDAIRQLNKMSVRKRAVINVTSDKCYANQEWPWGYRETDPLGGYDPYSNSKGCSELITSSYRNCFFNPQEYSVHGVAVATARAGNVIGGGDFAKDRLVPDCIRSILREETIKIRYPQAVRPWQHVLEPLHGYLILAQRLMEIGPEFSEAWNFGPHDDDIKPVEWITREICERWGDKATYRIEQGAYPHEARLLKLDCSKAKYKLGWSSHWDLREAIHKTIEWVKDYQEKQNIRDTCIRQIHEFSCWHK